MASSTPDTGKVFQNENVRIEGNIIRCQENFIQISNISQVWTGQLPKKPLPWLWIIALCAAGAVALWQSPDRFGNPQPVPVLLGLALLIAGIGLGLWTANSNQDLFGLHIEMSSGGTYSFVSSSTFFIQEAFETISEIVRTGKTTENILMNFGSGTIVNQSQNVSA
ncbi:MAG: DUF6232 family protein [Christensenellaceae bacterium]|jgi:hypothetical protein|nr:DUF6232 family protein [Christensenellaceae bacterium]